MARVLALVPDLLFGSNVLGSLQAAGHEAQLVSSLDGAPDAEVLIVDLTADVPARIAEVGAVRDRGWRTLGYYSHVESDVRAQAQAAGFDLVVPRSRVAREGAGPLVDRLLTDK